MVTDKFAAFALVVVQISCTHADLGRENTQEYLNGLRPTQVQYASDPMVFYQGNPITAQIPNIVAKQAVKNCYSAPALPTGLMLDNLTCRISGTPALAQALATYTITAANDMGSHSVQISIRVSIPPPSNLVYTGSPFAFVKAAPITTITPTVTGTVTSCTVNPALPGLTLDNTTCAISGTPTTSQLQTTHTITAANADGSTSTTIDLTIFRVIFVGGARGGSNIANSGVADADCNIGTGNHPGYGTYKAMIVGWGTRRACSSMNCVTSGAAENLDWVLAPDTEYRRPDAVTKIITTNSAGVGSIVAAFIASGVTAHWTGLTTDWRTQGATGTCGGSWSTGATTGAYGRTNSAGSIALFDALASPCSSNNARLICAQQ